MTTNSERDLDRRIEGDSNTLRGIAAAVGFLAVVLLVAWVAGWIG